MCILLLPGAYLEMLEMTQGTPKYLNHLPPPSATMAPKDLSNNIRIENSTNKSFIFNKSFHFHYAKEAREPFLVVGGQ